VKHIPADMSYEVDEANCGFGRRDKSNRKRHRKQSLKHTHSDTKERGGGEGLKGERGEKAIRSSNPLTKSSVNYSEDRLRGRCISDLVTRLEPQRGCRRVRATPPPNMPVKNDVENDVSCIFYIYLSVKPYCLLLQGRGGVLGPFHCERIRASSLRKY